MGKTRKSSYGMRVMYWAFQFRLQPGLGEYLGTAEKDGFLNGLWDDHIDFNSVIDSRNSG